MSTTVSESRARDLNALFVSVVPELNSSYAKYPLSSSSGRNQWVDPGTGRTSKGEPCFIKGSGGWTQTTPTKQDYAYGPGPLGFGYYHFLTRESYAVLYGRLQSSPPVACCAFTSKQRKMMDDYEEVKKFMWYRSKGSVPDDAQAQKDAIAIAQGTAKMIYNYTQNEQLFLNAVGTAVFIGAN